MEFILCAALLAADEPNDWYFWGGGYAEEIEIDFDLFGSSGNSPKETGLRLVWQIADLNSNMDQMNGLTPIHSPQVKLTTPIWCCSDRIQDSGGRIIHDRAKSWTWFDKLGH